MAVGDPREVIVTVPSDGQPGAKAVCYDSEGQAYSLRVPKQALPGDRLVLRFPEEDGINSITCTISRTQQEQNVFEFHVPAWATPGETELDIQNSCGQKRRVRIPPNVEPADRLTLFVNPDGTCKCEYLGIKRILEVLQSTMQSRAEVWASMGSCRVQPSEAQVAYEKLAQHIRSAGGFVNPKIARAKVPPLDIAGVVAMEPIADGEELCRIPEQLHISPATVAEIWPELWREVGEVAEYTNARIKASGISILMTHLLYLAEERCLLGVDGEQLSEVVSGVCSSLDDGRRWPVWQSYADELLGLDFSDHPHHHAALDPDACHALLEPSNEAFNMTQIVKGWEEAYHRLQEHCSPTLLGPHFCEPRLFFHNELCFSTRAFQLAKGQSFVPLADDFNHSTSPGVRHYQQENGAFVVKAMRVHVPGEELFISYGVRPNPELYSSYGFTVAPNSEPAWSYEMQPRHVGDIFDAYLSQTKRHQEHMLQLSSSGLSKSLCNVLNAAAEKSNHRRAGEFLSLVCARCISLYRSDKQLLPALAALERAQAKEPSSSAWWAELEEGSTLSVQDAVRVKMSEYLCLTAHVEAVLCAEGLKSEDVCLKDGAPLRRLIRNSLERLAAGGFLTPTDVSVL